tara:strand:+ start:1179 stop:1427 length:249 start_codon:yes stop_codon:yes gene_type:complete
MRNHGTTREEWLAIGLCAAEDAITRLLDACKDCNVTESIQTCLKHTLAQVREAVAVSASADQVHQGPAFSQTGREIHTKISA